MAIADTRTFNPDIGDIAEEAFELAGTELRTGNDIRTARRSLNYLMLEWQNMGINLWRMDEVTISAIVKGTATYDIDINTISILDAFLRTNTGSTTLQSDLIMTRISQPTYSQITNKLHQARPLQYFFQRIGVQDGSSGGSDVNATVTLWPVPDKSSTYELVYWRMKRISDTGASIGNTMQTPDRFLPAVAAGLAYKIAMKKPALAGRVGMLKQSYDEILKNAFEEDREKASLLIVPDMSGYR